jgi:hypothetical protein
MDDTMMNHLGAVLSKDFERQAISHIVGNSNPPSWFLFRGRERCITIKVQNRFVETVFKESGDFLDSSMS